MKKLLIQPLLLILGLSILFPLKSKAVAPSESIELAKKIPLADLHMHVYGERGSTPSNLLRYMRENNIRWGGGVGHYQVEMQRPLELDISQRLDRRIGPKSSFLAVRVLYLILTNLNLSSYLKKPMSFLRQVNSRDLEKYT